MRSLLAMVLQAKNLLEIGQKQRVMVPNRPLPISSRISYWLFTIMSPIVDDDDDDDDDDSCCCSSSRWDLGNGGRDFLFLSANS